MKGYIWMITCMLASCKGFLEVEPNRSQIKSEIVFESEASATSAVTAMYYTLMYAQGFANGSHQSITMLAGLSSDELFNCPKAFSFIDFENNDLMANNNEVKALWESAYKVIYLANAVIKGTEGSASLSTEARSQLHGEGLFMRAFCHFYLINLFGDVPLVIGTDYAINAKAARTPVAAIYDQIVEDLEKAYAELNPAYTSAERIRVNKSVAGAFLARVHLYRGEWAKAAEHATRLIDDRANYVLEPLNKVFLIESQEVILRMRPLTAAQATTGYTNEGYFFGPNMVPQFNALRPEFVQHFETGDQRREEWISLSGTLYHPYKYKANDSKPDLSEYSVTFRLAEQYLIRAEARARLQDFEGAARDIDSIRIRASLAPTTAGTEAQLITAIEQERKMELFTEWGHRWFDLKRWNRADAVLKPLKPKWTMDDMLYPLPEDERKRNPFLKPQNSGY